MRTTRSLDNSDCLIRNATYPDVVVHPLFGVMPTNCKSDFDPPK